MERAAQATPTPATIANTWENRLADIDVLRATPGQATLTGTLIGHPAGISAQAAYTDLISPLITIPPLSKGIPMPPRIVCAAPRDFVATKPWRKAASALEDAATLAIIEGAACTEGLRDGYNGQTRQRAAYHDQAESCHRWPPWCYQ